MSTPTSPGQNLETAAGPVNSGSFAAQSSLVTAAAQTIPPGCAAVTALAASAGGGLGITVKATGKRISRASFRFTGDAANVAGQTATMVVLLNGVAIPGATSGALATTAGNKSADVNFTTPVELADGDRLTSTFTPSAGLTAACTNVETILGV